MLADVLDVALEVGEALLQRGEVLLVRASFTSTPPWYLSARIVATITAASGRRPDLRHLMSTNFSAPRSAPKPASVTT